MIKVLKSVVVGPLQRYAAGLAAELERQGYTVGGAEKQAGLAAHLSRWMAGAGVEPGDLSMQVAQRYASARRAAGYASYRSVHALEPLLGYLRGLGVTPATEAVPLTAVEELLGRFQGYLVSERGIGAATAEGYACFVRLLVAARLASGGPGLEGLTAADVTAFVVVSCPGKPKGSAKLTVTALRSLLVWLHVDGVLDESLAWAVPSVASWRLARLPRPLEPGQVDAVLASCDRSTANGRRDLAMPTLLARLGLRAGEVAALMLEDIDPADRRRGPAPVQPLHPGRPPGGLSPALVTLETTSAGQRTPVAPRPPDLMASQPALAPSGTTKRQTSGTAHLRHPPARYYLMTR